MNFTKEQIDIDFLTTEVDNLFITKYMLKAPDSFIKIYLYGLFCATHNIEARAEEVASLLGVEVSIVEMAWEYWEKEGLITLAKGNIVFRLLSDIGSKRVKSDINNTKNEGEKIIESTKMINYDIKTLLNDIEIIKGNFLKTQEIQAITHWVLEDGIKPIIVKAVYKYCTENLKGNLNYIEKVAFEWNKKGLNTEEEMEDFLKEMAGRKTLYRQVLINLGLNRGPSKVEKDMIDSWTDDMGFSEERILEACEKAGFTAYPDLRYVNGILENWAEKAKSAGVSVNKKITVTKEILRKYYEHIRQEALDVAKSHEQQVYEKVPEIKRIDKSLLDLRSQASMAIIKGLKADDIERIKEEVSNLESNRAVLLTENNFSVDYTNVKYRCDKCQDTGVDENGGQCSCIRDRMGEAELWQKTV